MLSSHSTNIFSTLIDKVSIDSILDCLSHNNSHIQHIMITMISMLINDTNMKSFSEKVRLLNLYQFYFTLDYLFFLIEINFKINSDI
jgi:hypothetical protein